jgi:hypothetical protein
MLNPLRSEQEAFRMLLYVLVFFVVALAVIFGLRAIL